MRSWRLLLVSFGLFSLFSCLIIRFYQIQIVEGEKWATQAKSQHQLLVTIPAKRGLFYGNHSLKEGHPSEDAPLVVDVAKFHLYLDPVAIKTGYKEEIAQKLENLIGLSRTQIASHLYRNCRSRKVMMWLDPEKKEEIESWWQTFAKNNRLPRNALYFIQDYKRSYPYGKLLGQVLHTVSEEREAKSGQWVPTGGLEVQYNALLSGRDGKNLLLRSPRHPLDLGIVLDEAQNGADIYLTINPYLQAIAEEEIAKAVESNKAKSGFAIMMDPYTGHILALAQYPFFYPDQYKRFFNDPNLVGATRIKAITDSFEPGSCMKVIAMSLMLLANEELKNRGEKPLFDPKEMIRCDRAYFPGRTKPLKDVRTHKYLNMELAIQKSSNVYLANLMERVIERLGPQWYHDQLVNIFGFGQKTGIELPSESQGFVPKPGKKYPSGHLQWSPPTPYSLIMGYNLMANPLQLLRAYAIFANGGYRVKPTLVRKIVQNGKEWSLSPPAAERVLPETIAINMKKGLKYVTKPGGSGTAADIYGYTEAGKTSTTEKINQGVYSFYEHFANFIGFTPADHPRFVLMVGIDEPEYRFLPGIGRTHFGGKCAAPVFKAIGTRALHYLGVAPDDPYGYPKGDPRSDLERADWMVQTKKLAELYNEWN